MALLDRVKERVETDLLDPELLELIGEAQQVIRDRWGPDRSTATPTPVPIIVTLPGFKESLDLARPLDEAQAVIVTEYTSSFVAGAGTVLVAVTDYRVYNGGRTLVRQRSGCNSRWGATVQVEYVPQTDQTRRDEVVIKLVRLATQYEGVSSTRVGDTSTNHEDYLAQRNRLISSLAPRSGMHLA